MANFLQGGSSDAMSRGSTQVIGEEEMRPDERLKNLIETFIKD